MPLKRFFALLVALVALVTPTFTRQLSTAQATTSASPNAVIAWNEIAQRAAIQVAKLSPAHSSIVISFAQAAVYDAVVAIEGGYQPYQVRLAKLPAASLDAAVATAAHHVLVHYFPTQQAALDADYATSLGAVPNGAAKVAGIAVGQATAAGIIARRQGDGFEVDIGFTMPAPAPGVWELPVGQNPLTPWVSKLRPFTLRSPNQFRPVPPTALTSRAWAADFNEVKAIGSLTSTSRTAEQTDIARFWTTHPIAQYNIAFKQIALDRRLSTVQAARLFAMGNMVGADAAIACWDAKYHYLFWRPQFAIPAGDSDGNPRTAGDPTWTPLVATPPHPEYPSGHSCLTAAEMEVLTAFLGTDRIDVDITSATPNLVHSTRHFEYAADLTQEVMNARVWGGIHFRDATVKGGILGRKVARWALNHYFQPER